MRFEGPFHSLADMMFRTVYGDLFKQFLLQRVGFEDVPGRKRANDVTRAFSRWAQKNSAVPFFVFLNLFDAHTPYLPPQPFRSKFSRWQNPGGLINWNVGRPRPSLDPEQVQSEMDAYDGGIAFMDDAIGRLLADLGKQEIGKNLLVVILSDHGEEFMEHGSVDHRNGLYRELIHVPLMLQWPGHLPAGVRIARPVSIASLPGTVMDLIGAGNNNVFPGPSLAQLWRGATNADPWPNPMAELGHMPFESPENPCKYGAMDSLVSPAWQYIAHQRLGEQLYDWKNDVGELNNLANTPTGQAITSNFELRLQRRLGKSNTAFLVTFAQTASHEAQHK